MTDWVAQDDWSKPKIGDQVRVTHEDDALTGTVVDRYVDDSGYLTALVIDARGFTSAQPFYEPDWQLSVPAKPAVELPTEPDWYQDREGDLWKLGDDKLWWLVDRGDLTLRNNEGVASFAPFTRLEPVAVTAKKVLHFFEHDMSDDVFEAARKEFGVTE